MQRPFEEHVEKGCHELWNTALILMHRQCKVNKRSKRLVPFTGFNDYHRIKVDPRISREIKGRLLDPAKIARAYEHPYFSREGHWNTKPGTTAEATKQRPAQSNNN